MDTTEQRLSSLERQVRSYRRIALSAVALLTVGLTGAVLHHQEKVIECDVLKAKKILLSTGDTTLVMTPTAIFDPKPFCKKLDIDVDATIATMTEARALPDQAKEMLRDMLKSAFIELKPDLTYVSGVEMMGKKQVVNGTWRPAGSPLAALTGKSTRLLLHQTHADDREEERDSTAELKDGVLTISVEQQGKMRKMVFGKSEKK